MYVDLAGLARYKRDFDAWARGALLPKDAAAARVRTAKAGAVSFVPVQETPLDVSVDFLFSETPPASGDKSPSNPSTITGVSNVKVGKITGKNLLAYNFSSCSAPSGTSTGTRIVFSNNEGVYSLSGASTSTSGVINFYITHITEESVKLPAGTYTLSGYEAPSGAPNGTGLQIAWYDLGGGQINNSRLRTGSFSFSVDRPFSLNVYFRNDSGTTYPDNFICKPQLEVGSVATEFEPSTVAYYEVPLNGTYYGGTLDVASGVMTVNYASYTFGGNTGFSSSAGVSEFTNLYRLAIYPTPARSTKDIHASCACNTFPVVSTNSDSSSCIRLGNNSSKIEVDLRKDLLNLGDGADFNTVKTAFNSFFSSYPATVVYVVSTPQTVQLTPAEILSLTQSSVYDPRVNTVYSDASAVQVGYLKHPSAASADLRNALVSLGGGV